MARSQELRTGKEALRSQEGHLLLKHFSCSENSLIRGEEELLHSAPRSQSTANSYFSNETKAHRVTACPPKTRGRKTNP